MGPRWLAIRVVVATRVGSCGILMDVSMNKTCWFGLWLQREAAIEHVSYVIALRV